LVGAPLQHRPTYLSPDLVGLLEAQPEVTSEGPTAGCGGWIATVRGSAGRNTIVLDGEGSAIDGLRALLRAAWSLGDVVLPIDADRALSRLGYS
jgi:hypothetical protein